MVRLLSFYKKTLVLLCCFFFLLTNCFSQNWLNGEGGPTNDEALDIAVDSSGNYYTTGYFTTTATFGTTVLNSNGISDIFIAKFNAAGIIQWAVKAGGEGSDRGYSIKTDGVGNLYVTGYYYKTAIFGSSSITSVGNSQDVFIAKYDISGNLLWVRSVGGSDAETGYGITSDNLGNVIVTGQFKGTAIFGTSTLSSAINPITTLPSFDIFTVKFDGNGNFLWVEQGRAKYDDRGLDVAVDLSNNIFIVGQFSDTIQFDAIHNNTVLNAGFLMKYDPSGNEQWFVKMSALQTILYGVAVDHLNNILITGDFKGNLGIFTNPIVYSTSTFLNKIFIAKFSNSGSVLWVENDGSNSEVTSKSIGLDKNGNAYITGLFKCRFDEYSQTSGTGIFYSSGYRDVFITKYSSIGVRQWFRHFGSNKDDYCSGIAVKTIDKPVIAGSFENRFNIPNSSAFTIFSTNVDYGWQTGFSYCGYSNYQHLVSQQTAGQKDIFVTSPVDISQAPFDYFLRYGICSQDFIAPCISNCQDTIHACSGTNLYANLFEVDTTYIGARYDYLWSTGATTLYSGTLNASGNYSLQSTREDGCFQNIDTVYVAIHPIPDDTWITDSYSINVNQPHSTLPIGVCGPDSITLWGTHGNIGDSVFWAGPAFTTIDDSTIVVTQTGVYHFISITQFGCYNNNLVSIEIQDTLPISPVIEPHIVFLDYTLQATDTIAICFGELIGAMVIDSGYYSINGGAIPNKITTWQIFPTGSVNAMSDPSNQGSPIWLTTSGWYTIVATVMGISNLCGSDTSQFPISRSFYVTVNPKPIITLNLTGPTNPCPGDSVYLIASSNVSPFSWTNGATINAYIDTMEVLAPSAGSVHYQIAATSTDTITGCSTSAFANLVLSARPYPIVTISPIDGIICPNDSVLLTSEPGLNYYWISASGDSIGTTQSIYVDVPGYYHCIHTAFDGCIQTSNFVEAKEYNTPYLVVEPGNFICINESATITVQASNSALIQWQPPLSGSSIIQNITSGGTYICHITQCGIVTIDSVVIIQSTTIPIITAASSMICPGDTLVLNGNPGMVSYEWVSQNSTDPFLYVTTPGAYILKITDIEGCDGFSVPFLVTAASALPSFSGDTTLCVGDSLIFLASNSGVNYSWTGPQGISGTLQSFSIPAVSALNQGYYSLQYSSSMCTSPIDSFYVTVNPIPTPHISSDSIIYICFGTTAVLSVDSVFSSYNWFPAGQTTQSILVDSNGTYYATVTQNACTGTSNAVTVSLNSPLYDPTASDTNICSGTTATLTASGAGILIWYDSSLNPVGTGTTYTIASADSSMIYFIQSIDTLGCTSEMVEVNIFVFQDSIQPIIYNSSPACVGDNIYLSTDSLIGVTYNWTGPGGFSSTLLSPIIFSVHASDSGLYQLIVTLDQCASPTGTTIAVVNPIPLVPEISGNTLYCEEDSLHLEITSPVPGSSYYWLSPTGNIISDSSQVHFSSLTLTDAGMYYLSVNKNGCYHDTTFNITIKPKPLAVANSNSPVCMNDTLLFYADTILGATYYWSGPSGYISTNPFNLILNANASISGIYQLTITLNGCTSDTTQVNIQEVDLPVIDLGLDTAFCLGTSVTFTMPQGYTYLWNDASTSDTYIAADSGTVTVTASVGPGCLTTDSVHVDDYQCLSNVPNIITPNGDGINDFLYFDTEGLRFIEVTIYDRWGALIYHWTDLNGYWNGRSLSNIPVVEGVYFYVANITGYDNKIKGYKGFVSVQK